MSIESARFRRPVRPGDQLVIKAVKQQSRKNVWKFGGQATVGGELVAEANYTAMIMND